MKPWYLLDDTLNCLAVLHPGLLHGFPYEEDVLTEKLSFDSSILEFELDMSHPMAKKVTDSSFILLPKRGNPQLFVVLETEEDGSGRKKVWCEPLCVTELGGHVLRPVQLHSVRAEEAVNHVLTGSGWVLGTCEGKGIRDLSFPDTLSALEALHTICHAFDLEIQFRIEMHGFRVAKKRVDIVKQRGRVIEQPLDVDKEEMELKKRVDRKERVTALIGMGLQKEDGSYLTFQEYVPPPTKGLEKQEDWVGDTEAKERNGKHIFGVYRDEKAQNPVELYRNTIRELKRRTRLHASYTLQAACFKHIGEEVNIGDRLLIQLERGKNRIQMRVMEKVTSRTNPEKNRFILEQV